ncbi:alpha/beta hydrolase [Brevundimonas nasdae]|uniref:alpha/beta hydrolase n=1 Tax=Brevundimonas nasdae TaxID=172043 RepID=UPI003F68DB8E
MGRETAIQDRSFSASAGNGKGVLLLHGMTGAPGEMKPLAKRLKRRGFDYSCPQLAGHGGTEKDLLKTDWRDWLDSARTAYEKFAREVDEVHVAGICAGGALGLLLASEIPEIRSAAVYSMTFEYDGWNMPRWAMGAPLIQLVANLPGVRHIPINEPSPFGLKDERLRAMAANAADGLIDGAIDIMPLGALYQLYRLGRRVEVKGPSITTPTLILHASEDDMSSPKNAKRLQACLAGETELHYLKDSFHMIHVDRERDLVAELSADFFARHSATASVREVVDA